MNTTKGKYNITYLLESTELWGGVKVVFEQAEALQEAGHKVTLLSKDSGPDWYKLKAPLVKVEKFDNTTIPESDIIIGTYWTTIKEAYPTNKGILVHLCQGYEGGNKELQHLKEEIDKIYKLKIPKLTVSPHLTHFLKDKFKSDSYYIGQMINRDIFYPGNTKKSYTINKNLRILVIGPFEADVKNIPTTLKGISIAKKNYKIPIILIRVSQFKLTDEEKKIIIPDYYYFHVPYSSMGEIYRSVDLLISMSKEAEGFDLPPLEAMACGIPTILSKIPAHLSYDTEYNYAYFTLCEPKAVAKAIYKLYNDKDLRMNIISNGLRILKKYDKKLIISNLNRIFEKLINDFNNQIYIFKK